MQRPDLSQASAAVREYIEHLEHRLRIAGTTTAAPEPPISDAPLPVEAPTTINILSISQTGLARRTQRHQYPRQHRSGLGVNDLTLEPQDYPLALASMDEDKIVLLFTNQARIFRLNINKIAAAGLREPLQPIFDRTPLATDEHIAAILPEQASGYVAMLSENGRVRTLRHHLFGEHMRPGTNLYRADEFGVLVSACWTPGDADLFITSRNGQAIRFSERLLNPQGDWGMRLSPGDRAVSVTSVTDDSGVFLVSSNGKGTIRLMSGFAPNKSTGGSGKIAMKTEELVNAFSVTARDEVFLASCQGKVIRFRVDEVPSSEGAVQGVYCMTLRNDKVCAALRSPNTAA